MDSDTATMTKATVSAEWLLRKDVYGPEAESRDLDKIGTVNDILMELGEGCAQWLVMRSGTDKYPLPWSSIRIDEKNRIVTDLEAERLEHAPRFDAKRPPDFADERWARSVYSYWGVDY